MCIYGLGVQGSYTCRHYGASWKYRFQRVHDLYGCISSKCLPKLICEYACQGTYHLNPIETYPQPFLLSGNLFSPWGGIPLESLSLTTTIMLFFLEHGIFKILSFGMGIRTQGLKLV